MAKLNKTCVMCHTKYSYCSSCNSMEKPRYMEMFCSENCKDIYFVVADYVSGNKDASVCKDILTSLDTSSVVSEGTKKVINTILGNNTEIKENEEVKEVSEVSEIEEKVDNEISIDTEEITKEETHNPTVRTYNRKKRKISGEFNI